MDTIRYIIAVIFGFFGLWGIAANWQGLWLSMKKKETFSWTPLIGGLFLCVAIAIIPNNPYAWLCWLAFVVDFGSLPIIILSIINIIKNKSKK